MSYYCVWCHTWAILFCLLLPLIILHKSDDMVAVFQMGINTITTFFTRLILLYNEQLFPVSVSVLWGVTTRNHNEALSVTVCIHLNVSVFFFVGVVFLVSFERTEKWVGKNILQTRIFLRDLFIALVRYFRNASKISMPGIFQCQLMAKWIR